MSPSPTEGSVLDTVAGLDRALDLEVRRGIRQRWESMLRECAYLQRTQNRRLLFIRQRGWTPERLGVQCWLSSFYQLFIGPLESSTRASTLGLGTETPVSHGSERFDTTRRNRTVEAAQAFQNLVAVLGLQRDWLTKNRAGDVVYYVERYERSRDSFFEERKND